MAQTNVHSFTMRTLDGRTQSLSAYKGKTLLIVNVASKCGFTKQYAGLQTLYERYRDRGLVVLGFPANDFMGQEPGTDAEIQKFCSTKFNVSFPMFAKISVKGKKIDPLYAFLTSAPGFEGAITWNFNKFLVDGEGRVIARFGSKTEPLSEELIGTLVPALGRTA